MEKLVMSVGNPATKNDIDVTAQQVAHTMRENFDRVRHFKIWLDAQTDLMLTERGYTSEEVGILRSAVGDLDLLRRIYEGTVGLAAPKDFQAFAKFLTGVS